MLFYHNSHWKYYRNPFGAVPLGERICLRLAVSVKIKPKEAYLRIWHDGAEERILMRPCMSISELGDIDEFNEYVEQSGRGQPTDDRRVKHPGTAGGYVMYEAYYTPGTGSGTPGLYWYYFIAEGEHGLYYFGNNYEMQGGEGVASDYPPQSYQITVYDKGFTTPDWIKHAVIYQIFPDRFFSRRDKKLTQEDAEKKRPDYIAHGSWDEKPIHRPDPRTGEIMNNDFFGGNLAGIEEKLPYLKRLGINTIYLNPIFEAYSNHKYDVGDYMNVDAMFGTNSDFERLCAEAAKRGIRIILDGVFSHTGSDSLYFNKNGFFDSVGAYQSIDSPYYCWYNFESHPDKYDCWWGFKTLPNLNEMEGGFLDYALRGKNSVVKTWLKRGASGWRLDVADEIPDEFLKILRENVKSANEDAVIIGEVWEDASNKVSYDKQREYFLGGELDSVMNYVFKDALIGFVLNRKRATDFHREIFKIFENYPKQVFYSLMNLIGGHDVERALTVLSECPSDISRDEMAEYVLSGEERDLGKKRLKLAALIQMTFPGAPSVYYGDEVGMAGFRDPFNRGPFPWGGLDAVIARGGEAEAVADTVADTVVDTYSSVRNVVGTAINGEAGTGATANSAGSPPVPTSADEELYHWHRTLIALRNSFAALRTGTYEPLLCKGGMYVYARVIRHKVDVFGKASDNGFALVAVNTERDGKRSVTVDLSGWNLPYLFDFLKGDRAELLLGKIHLQLPPISGSILIYPSCPTCP